MTVLPELERELALAAGRLASPRRRIARMRRVALPVAAGAVVALLVLVVFALGDDGEHERDRNRISGDGAVPPQGVPPPRRRGPEPLAGTMSEPVHVSLGGTDYTAVGFLADGSLVCVRLVRAPGIDVRGVGCLYTRLVEDTLADSPAHLFARGGVRPGLVQHVGLARSDVTDLVPDTSAGEATVVLSEPWRPTEAIGEPIRFFIVFRPAPADPGRIHIPLRARLENGRLVSVP